MRVQSSKIAESVCHKQNSDKSPSAASFADALEEANTFRNPVTVSARELLPLGVISDERPTVSDILVNNDQFSKDTWSIIHSAKNAQKDYARMQPGTKVFIDKNTFELIWGEDVPAVASQPTQYAAQTDTSQEGQTAGGADLPAAVPAAVTSGEAGSAGGEKISLGRLDRENSTVSHLLLQNPRYSRAAWRIIQADINSDKAFTEIRDGAEIFIDPQTMELSWQHGSTLQTATLPALEEFDEYEQATAVQVAAEEELSAAEEDQSDLFSSNLVQAVQPYLGKSYREIDCYGLVVRGLSRMGIKYGGRGGLQDQLVQMAKSKGLPENAYMTGEGLIEATGAKVFSRTLSSVGNAAKAADRIYDEMAPYLQKGYILSFSTPTRGHTGIVSQHDQTWTFINSGYMDNQVEKTGRSRGVGEEDLAREIKNWCRVAAKQGESLMVTLGRLQEEKLRTAQGDMIYPQRSL